MKRLKLYYPKSSIVENLSTNGSKYMLEDGTPYNGAYHMYDTGEVFTGAMWDPQSSMKLLPLVSVYNNPKLKNSSPGKMQNHINSDMNIRKYTNPKSEISIPNDIDFSNSFYYRYFCQKRNELSVIYEISNNSYITYGKVGGINEFLYKRGRIRWTLTGDEFDTYENGRFLRRGVLNQNAREVLALVPSFPYIQTIFGDYRQFTEYSKTNLNQVKPKTVYIPSI
jgi:hypothetical protein